MKTLHLHQLSAGDGLSCRHICLFLNIFHWQTGYLDGAGEDGASFHGFASKKRVKVCRTLGPTFTPEVKVFIPQNLLGAGHTSAPPPPPLSPPLTLNTSEKKPAPIFSRLKSSRRARLETALRRARYDDGRIRLGPWTLCRGGSASLACSGSSSISPGGGGLGTCA